MPSPFPGMDPYLESPKHWSDFHYRFIAHWCEILNEHLPRRYAARVEERVRLVRHETASFVQIVRFPEHTLVAVMELLSPWSKVAPGREE